jgi:hypothetical protein
VSFVRDVLLNAIDTGLAVLASRSTFVGGVLEPGALGFPSFVGFEWRSELGLAGRSDAEIVEFWQIVEMFSPQDVGKSDAAKWHSVVRAGEPLPWEDGHKLKSRRLKDDRVWRHTVYLGTYGLAAVFDTLKQVFEPDEEEFRPATARKERGRRVHRR